MGESSEETKNRLLQSAKKEFLEKGFMGASLRTIASNAGVTTGAMYRHFKDKDAFFCALVDDAIEVTTNTVMLADSKTHAMVDDVLSKEHYEFEEQSVVDLLNYMYKNFDAFTLLLEKSAGSTHEHFQEEICELYTKNCSKTFNWMYRQKFAKRKIDSMTVHFIASTIINSFADIIIHRMSKKEALSYIDNITRFTRYGTMHLLGIPCGEKSN